MSRPPKVAKMEQMTSTAADAHCACPGRLSSRSSAAMRSGMLLLLILYIMFDFGAGRFYVTFGSTPIAIEHRAVMREVRSLNVGAAAVPPLDERRVCHKDRMAMGHVASPPPAG